MPPLSYSPLVPDLWPGPTGRQEVFLPPAVLVFVDAQPPALAVQVVRREQVELVDADDDAVSR